MKNSITKIIVISIYICFAASCKRSDINSPKSIKELSTSLKSSQSFSRYMLFTERLERGLTADKYNLSAQTHDNLAKLISTKKTESINQFVTDFAASGVENAKEYFLFNENRMHYFHVLIHDFPELKSMSPKNAVALLNDVYYNQMHHKRVRLALLLQQRKANALKRQQLSSLSQISN